MRREQISEWQLGIALYISILGTTFLLMPSISTALAGNDMWITPILASIGGILPVLASASLSRRYPGRNFFGALEEVFGKPLGRILCALFLLFHLHICGATIRDYAEFIADNFFERTPMVVLIGSMLFVCALAVRAGPETIVRCAQLFAPVVVLLLLLNLVLLIPNMHPEELLPVFGNGALPILKGVVVVHGWFSQFILISALYPYASTSRPLRVGLWSVGAVTITMLVINLMVLFLFGNEAAKFFYPFLMASRYIRVADFIEHMEAMIMMSWVLGAFVRISLFFFMAVQGFNQVFGVRNYRLLAFPTGLILVTASIWVAPNMQALTTFISTWGTMYIMGGYVIFPLIVMGVASWRQKSGQPR